MGHRLWQQITPNIADEVPAPLAAAEVGGEMEISEEKDFAAKILEISEDLPSNPLKEIVKADAGKENVVVDKVVNGTNGVLKIANGGSTENETAVETLSTDISNGERVSQVNGDEKSETSTGDNILEDTIDNILEDTVVEDEPDQKESEDSADILPTKEETSEKVNCEQSTDDQSKEEEEEGESAIGDKEEESSPVENGVHDTISDGIEEKEEADANSEQTDATAEEEENLEEEEEKSILEEKLEEKDEEHLVNDKTDKDALTAEISEQSDQNSTQADRESIDSGKKEENDAMEESEEEVIEDTSEDTLEKEANEEESQDGCEAREPNKPEEKEEISSDSETDKLKAAVADDASEEEEEEVDIGKSLDASLENLERKLEEESDEVTHLEVPTREGSVTAKEGESGEKEKDVALVTGNSSDADDEGDSKMSTDQNDSEAEEPNAEEALASLAQIEKNTKRILDDDWNDESDSSRKRTADEGSAEPSVKKAKLDSEPKAEGNDEAAAMKKKIKKSLKKLKRSEIEEMIATKCVELLTNKSEVGKLRQQVWIETLNKVKIFDENPDLKLPLQVDSYQETVERWKRRAGALSKQCTDLSTVMRKYITGTNSSQFRLVNCHEQITGTNSMGQNTIITITSV